MMKNLAILTCILVLILFASFQAVTDKQAAAATANPLEAVDDSYRADVNAPLSVDPPGVLANDLYGTTATPSAILVEAPSNGRLQLEPDGSFSYAPDPDFLGTDQFLYRFTDGTTSSNSATVTITVPATTGYTPQSTGTVEPLAVSTPLVEAIDDFSETVDGVRIDWEKGYYQDRDIAGGTLLEIPFGVNRPPGYDPSGSQRYPLVLYLHGASARSDWTATHSDPDLRNHSLVDAALRRATARFFARASQTNSSYRAFVLAPQVPSLNHMWVGTSPHIPYNQTDIPGDTYSEYMHLTEHLLDFLIDSANSSLLLSELGFDAADIDISRIYVVGDSAGAKGVWDIVARRPAFFQGGISGAGTGPRNKLTELRQTPLWAIHGILDDVVPNELPSAELPYGSGSLGILAQLDAEFDNTASTATIYKDDPLVSGDDPIASDRLIYSEFPDSYTHSSVAVYWTDKITGTLSWLFAQEGTLNSAPVAQNQSVSTLLDIPLDITLTASDPDGDALTYFAASSPSHGTLSGTPPELTYSPDAGYTGDDSFTFTASDGELESNTATVSIAVTAVSGGSTTDGDVDRDGLVTSADARLALEFALGIKTPTAEELEHGDVAPLVDGSPDPDGVITAGDAEVILRKAMGLVTW